MEPINELPSLSIELTMAKTIRVGLLGARFAARFHWDGYRRVYGIPVQVVGVTSKSAESREAFAREHGIEAFGTLEEICEAADVIERLHAHRRP